MSVNGVTSSVQPTPAYEPVKTENVKAAAAQEKDAKTGSSSAADQGVVYEPSKADAADSAKKTYKPNTELINKLKADADARTQQLRSLVEKMMSGQVESFGKATDMWQFLRSGNYTVDAATKLQAQADIAEDGYWGVKQTSGRILDFAKALTGGDPSKIEDMRKAFQKGYKQAEKTWGGNLPDISRQTYDAVMKGFDDMSAAADKAAADKAAAAAEKAVTT